MTGRGAWQEADRLDRERYAHPSRICDAHAEPKISGSSTSQMATMKPQGTHYALLGVERSASAVEVRRAYRRLLVTAHPDKGGLREQFEQLQAAYAVLSSPAERIIYDEKLDLAAGYSSTAGAGSGPAAAMGCKVQRAAKGVTAVVHGQQQGTPQQQTAQSSRGTSHACSADSTCELAAATAAIQALRAAEGSPDAAALAAAHLARALLYGAAGQLHHAIFDAEEAVRLQPDIHGAAGLAGQLAAALEEREAGGQAEQQQHGSGSSSGSCSGSDVEDPF